MVEGMELRHEVDQTPERGSRILTVCIPTHNRREVLEECLASVLPQAEALGVGVCVSDNGSSDGTWQALETLKRKYPWMQTMRHARDIGYRDNLTGVVLSSHARYVWPLGDKYILFPGALEFVVGELVRLHPDALLVNCPGQFVSTVERLYSVPQLCLREMGWWTTLCGATVLPRQAYVDVLHVQPLSKDFPQVIALFSYLASLSVPQVLFSGRVLIQQGKFARENHVAWSWAGYCLETWGRNWYDAVMSLPALYSANDKLRAVRSKSEHGGPFDLRGLIELRLHGELTLQRLNANPVPLRAAVSAPWQLAVIISAAPWWMLCPVLHVHPRLMVRAMRRRLRLPRRQQAHRSAH